MRDFSIRVVRILRDAGFEALWAGGCVRDMLLHRTPKDYDVATDARPDQVVGLFRRHRIRTLTIGAAFGVVAIIEPKPKSNSELGSEQRLDSGHSRTIEVATFREDLTYSDGRRPDAVRFANAEVDAGRRDFTINGLFYDPIAEKVLDYVGGVHDLETGLLRAIGDPLERFAEDKLRMLRAIRFTTTLDFRIAPATLDAVRWMASQIGCVSQERIAAEMERILTDPNRPRGLELLRDSRLGREVLPEFFDVVDDVGDVGTGGEGDRYFHAAARRLAALGSDDFGTVLATLGWGVLTPDAMNAIGLRWKLSNAVRERAVRLLWQIGGFDAAADRISTLQPLLGGPDAMPLMTLRRTLAATDEMPATIPPRIVEMATWPVERLHPAPLLTGDTLREAGYRPGPQFREVLAAVFAAQLDGEITTTAEAVLFAATMMRSCSG